MNGKEGVKKFLIDFSNKLLGRTNDIVSTKNYFNNLEIVQDDICIDCGANVGCVTQQMAEFGAIVYAFEPNPHPFEILRKKFKNNKKIHCVNKGVWDKNSTMSLYFHKNSDKDEVMWSTGSSLLDYKKNVNKDKNIDVEVIDLSEFIINLNSKVKILKIDVEGVEVEILNKLIDKNLHTKIEYIFVETHDHKIPELKDSTNKIRTRIYKENIKNINLNWE